MCASFSSRLVFFGPQIGLLPSHQKKTLYNLVFFLRNALIQCENCMTPAYIYFSPGTGCYRVYWMGARSFSPSTCSWSSECSRCVSLSRRKFFPPSTFTLLRTLFVTIPVIAACLILPANSSLNLWKDKTELQDDEHLGEILPDASNFNVKPTDDGAIRRHPHSEQNWSWKPGWNRRLYN